MLQFLRTGAFALLLATAVLWAGCDTAGTNGTARTATGPSLQFASEVAATAPADSLFDIAVTLSDTVGAEVSVEVLFAVSASSARFADIGTFDSATVARSVTFPAGAAPGDTQFVEVDVSDADISEGPREAFFALQNASPENTVEIGNPRELTLNIGYPSLAQVRSQGVGTTAIFEAVVTEVADDDARVQDGMAGIAVTRRSDFTGAVQRGDLVRITGTISTFANQLQIDTDDLQNYEVVSSGNPLPDVQEVTVPEIQENVDEYENERIRVENLTIDPGGDSNFQAGGSAGNYTATDDEGNEMTLRIPSGSYYGGESIPEGPITFEGVLGEYFTGPQMRAQYEDNIITQD